jgi:hypothetical protein
MVILLALLGLTRPAQPPTATDAVRFAEIASCDPSNFNFNNAVYCTQTAKLCFPACATTDSAEGSASTQSPSQHTWPTVTLMVTLLALLGLTRPTEPPLATGTPVPSDRGLEPLEFTPPFLPLIFLCKFNVVKLGEFACVLSPL